MNNRFGGDELIGGGISSDSLLNILRSTIAKMEKRSIVVLYLPWNVVLSTHFALRQRC
jgi:hypothetical protein